MTYVKLHLFLRQNSTQYKLNTIKSQHFNNHLYGPSLKYLLLRQKLFPNMNLPQFNKVIVATHSYAYIYYIYLLEDLLKLAGVDV